ncbi:CaiB/BaiF CoA transferase family protein [Ruixingdingia sedimenti]|uniref:CoA transferase n=1 Tax=Ruixingdingia sedimenti TaxID=3073604 RepID=A0ABU1F7D8_9RHOB|nr:CoA transferase [Xinfangfangia sp. LG-4]MDR5652773.1 CoA transferase [Xinfangfangia sp. LG-4]
MPPTPPAAALSGIRVLDLSRVLAGPWAAQILGDLGAEVIKVEQPGRGDDTRAWGPPFIAAGEGPGQLFTGYYLACNRNKQAVAIDMSRPEGAGLIRRLAAESDVVIENFKVGGLAKYGLDYDSLRQVNPRLVYCSVTGFGQDGPYAPRGGYDFLIQALGGLMSVTGPDGGEPTKVGVPVVDIFTGLYATIAIQAALRHRDRTGEGQHIDCALLDTAITILANQGTNYLIGGTVPRPMGNAHPNVVPYRPFEVADGHVVVAVGNDGQFQALCRMLGRDDIAADPRFADNRGRVENRVALESLLAADLAPRPRAEVLAAMLSFGVPGGPINTVAQAFEDPQVIARGMLERHVTAAGTELPLTRFPAVLSATPAQIRRLPPGLGADTDAVLGGLAGLDAAALAALRDRGVIG